MSWKKGIILILSSAFFISSCHRKDIIFTEFDNLVCIKPYYDYTYKTCEDIHFKVNQEDFIIPKGFVTDLASIPKPFWIVVSPAHSALMRASIVHDWFYKETCDFNRINTDLIFYHMLINEGLSIWESSIFYYAVRLFGAESYTEEYCE